MWIILGLVSCIFLGLYDVFKKLSLKDNAVLPVLFFASATSAVIFLPVILFSKVGWIHENSLFFVPPVSLHQHLLLSISLVKTMHFQCKIYNFYKFPYF